jgi:hypothetical protein
MNTDKQIEALAETWVNDGTWGYPIEGDEPSQMMFRELKKAFIEGYKAAKKEDVCVASENVEQLKKERQLLLDFFDDFLKNPQQTLERVKEANGKLLEVLGGANLPPKKNQPIECYVPESIINPHS